MSATDGAVAQWLSQARIAEDRLTAEQRGLLQYAFAFRERCGDAEDLALGPCSASADCLFIADIVPTFDMMNMIGGECDR